METNTDDLLPLWSNSQHRSNLHRLDNSRTTDRLHTIHDRRHNGRRNKNKTPPQHYFYLHSAILRLLLLVSPNIR